MSRLILSSIAIAALCLVMAPGARPGAQQKRATYGPVVGAYLTGLDEELNELEYQLAHREIGRADYLRAKQRLTILRRFVERYAAQRGDDIVPEFQVLTEDEFGTLGLGFKPQPDELRAGEVIEREWKLISIERGRPRFFVFERAPLLNHISSEGERPRSERSEKIDPLQVIETIIVPDKPRPAIVEPAPANNADSQAAPVRPRIAAAPVEVKAETEPEPQLQGPRILHIYLPQYTEKARQKRIEGELIVSALFQSDGRIKNVKVEKGLGLGLDQRAVDSVKRIGFLPARFEGREIDAYAQIAFDFNLDKVTMYILKAEKSVSLQGGRP